MARHRPALGAGRGRQDPAPRADGRRDLPGAPAGRGRQFPRPAPPQPGRRARRRGAGRLGLDHYGAGPGAPPVRHPGGAGHHAPRGDPHDHGAGGARPAGGPRLRRHPPRRQALQYPHQPRGPGQADGLRHLHGRAPAAHDRHRHGHGNRPVPGPGAGHGQYGHALGRPVRPGHHRLRGARRAPPLHRLHPGGDRLRARQPGGPPDPRERAAGGPRRHYGAAEQVPRRPPRLGPRARPPPRPHCHQPAQGLLGPVRGPAVELGRPGPGRPELDPRPGRRRPGRGSSSGRPGPGRPSSTAGPRTGPRSPWAG